MSKVSIEAVNSYAQLLEETTLDFYRHLHPQISQEEFNNSVPVDPDNHLATEFIGDAEDDGTSTNYSSDVSEIHQDTGLSEINANISSCGSSWSSIELDYFFKALARHSRHRPDLIAEDMNDTKSTSQIVHLISTLESAASKNVVEGFGAGIEGKASLQSRKARRIATMDQAVEMSDAWVGFETKVATVLWEDEHKELPEAVDHTDENISSTVSWDDQVCYALLFLRSNIANPDFKCTSLFHLNNLSERQINVRVFRSFFGVELLNESKKRTGQGRNVQSHSYEAFSRDHPVPYRKARRGTAKDELIPWRILYRGVELGILKWIREEGEGSASFDNHHASPDHFPSESRLAEFEKRDGWLCFTEQFIKIDRTHIPSKLYEESLVASAMINTVRDKAKNHLLNSLEPKELEELNTELQNFLDFSKVEPSKAANLHRSRHGEEVDMAHNANAEDNEIRTAPLYKGFDLSHLSTLERRRAQSRINRRIQTHGLEAARSMPLEASHRGKKRKTSLSPVMDSRAGKHVTRGRQQNENRESDEQEACEQEACEHYLSTRFRSIGVDTDEVRLSLRASGVEWLCILDLDYIANLLRRANTSTQNKTKNCFAQSVSIHTLLHLTNMLRTYVADLVSSSIKEAVLKYPSRTDMQSDVVHEDHVVTAIEHVDRYSSYGTQGETKPVFFGDSYISNYTSKPFIPEKDGFDLYFSGLKGRAAYEHPITDINYMGIRSDGAISARDAFVIPHIRLQRDGCTSLEASESEQYDSDNDSEVIYDGPDQETVLSQRQDESLGVRTESFKVDGRRWSANEKRQEAEQKRWDELEARDKILAKRHEERLWRQMGAAAEDWHITYPSSYAAGSESSSLCSDEGETEQMHEQCQSESFG